MLRIADFEDFLKNRIAFFDADVVPEIREIGDGNINRVYRAADPSEGRSVILKHAEPVPRFSDAFRLSVRRGKNEAAYLRRIGALLPGTVPDLIAYDPGLRLIVMEDLGNAPLLRDALRDDAFLRLLPERLADFTAKACFYNSDFYLSSGEKKKLQNAFSNPSLCALTEKLVFADPYLLPPDVPSRDNRELFAETLTREPVLRAAAALRFRFMNAPQALIHGDLHFGSVFAKPDGVVVFDPEFCFFGPVGYDLGNLIAHFLLEACAADLTDRRRGDLLREALCRTVSCFSDTFSRLAETECRDALLRRAGFAETFVSSVLADAAGYAGTEIIRRVAGIAKLPALTACPSGSRAALERTLVSLGVSLLSAGPSLRTPDACSDFFHGNTD